MIGFVNGEYMSKRITIADVAEEAGVSMMTVSRAINNKAKLARQRGSAYCKLRKRWVFSRAVLARGLATQRTATIVAGCAGYCQSVFCADC